MATKRTLPTKASLIQKEPPRHFGVAKKSMPAMSSRPATAKSTLTSAPSKPVVASGFAPPVDRRTMTKKTISTTNVTSKLEKSASTQSTSRLGVRRATEVQSKLLSSKSGMVGSGTTRSKLPRVTKLAESSATRRTTFTRPNSSMALTEKKSGNEIATGIGMGSRRVTLAQKAAAPSVP